MKLAGKAAIVTGGGSGQGRAVALLFAAAGAAVAVADVNEQGGAATLSAISAAGGKAIFVRCDIAQSAAVQALVKATVAAFGRLDILYNNAALNRTFPMAPDTVLEVSEDHWNATITTNLSGYFLCAKYALPHLLEQGAGAIVNVASIHGLGTAKRSASYMASKTAVVALTRSMAIDYGPSGIRVNAICPGPIDTPRFRTAARRRSPAEDEQFLATIPLRRLGTPEEIARVALFLVSDDSSFITGAAIPVDGGRVLSM